MHRHGWARHAHQYVFYGGGGACAAAAVCDKTFFENDAVLGTRMENGVQGVF